MEIADVEAIYEHGILKLARELPLQEGQKVTITIQPAARTTQRRRGLIQWKGSTEDLDYLILSEESDPLEEGDWTAADGKATV